MSQPNQPQLPTQSEFKIGRQGNTVRVQIVAPSEEQAKRLYEIIEQTCIAIAKSELEFNWHKGN